MKQRTNDRALLIHGIRAYNELFSEDIRTEKLVAFIESCTTSELQCLIVQFLTLYDMRKAWAENATPDQA